MKPTITAREHYDRLAEMGNGRNDPPFMQEYMARWDGPPFWNAIGDVQKKDVLEVGVGVGRIARQMLKLGCRSLTGLDISPRSIAAAGADLSEFSNLKLITADITEFCKPESFDVACSVLTFMHVQNKRKALKNIVNCLRPGGCLVLSIDKSSDSLDFGDWMIPLFSWAPERYAEVLESIGCRNVALIPLIDTWKGPDGQKTDTYGDRIATIIKAARRL